MGFVSPPSMTKGYQEDRRDSGWIPNMRNKDKNTKRQIADEESPERSETGEITDAEDQG